MGHRHSTERKATRPSGTRELGEDDTSDHNDDFLREFLLMSMLNGDTSMARQAASNLATAMSCLSEDERQLHRAIVLGNKELVRELLSHGVGRLEEDYDENPLNTAAAYGHLGIVNQLLAAGANVNVRGSKLWTPLHSACHGGHVQVVRILLEAGANKEAKDNLGWTPLHVCCFMDQEGAAFELLSAEANPNSRENDGWTPLQTAVNNRRLALVALLLGRGAAPDLKNGNDDTALHIACNDDEGSGHSVKLLLESSANPNVENADHLTPIYFAIARGHERKVSFLLDHGADLNWHGDHGITPLGFAASNQEATVTPSLLQQLLESGANPNLADEDGRTPLIAAIVSCFHAAVDILISFGADVEAEDRSKMRAIHFAALQEQIEDLQSLIRAGADPSARGLGNITPLHLVARQGNEACVEALIDAGADVTAKSSTEELEIPLLQAIFGSNATVAPLARAVAEKESREWQTLIPGLPATSLYKYWPGRLPSCLRDFWEIQNDKTKDGRGPGSVLPTRTYVWPMESTAIEPTLNCVASDLTEPRLTHIFFVDVDNQWFSQYHRLMARLIDHIAPKDFDYNLFLVRSTATTSPPRRQRCSGADVIRYHWES
ncbi:unnamed protein product [Fusarium fujikuroi]|uniref:Ankyrin 3 n=1 Tax=Fusarium fujikuroi TaxID=5127 RepID=A0A9Q9RSJ6_FUSFU|nr:unnamed protein product [Fusarium fujikuroi]VZI04232.1 unnamed protein product [Fusarium fujikuroi]